MASHASLPSQLAESLPEYLTAVELCLGHHKPAGGCLGYPAAAMLCIVVDALGSYLTREVVPVNAKVNGRVETKRMPINKEHFRVLNSKLFNSRRFRLRLSEADIKSVKEYLRNPTVHNTVVQKDHGFFLGDPNGRPFTRRKGLLWVNLPALAARTREAVKRFLAESEQHVPGSEGEKAIERRFLGIERQGSAWSALSAPPRALVSTHTATATTYSKP
jgi:hypothetical protein